MQKCSRHLCWELGLAFSFTLGVCQTGGCGRESPAAIGGARAPGTPRPVENSPGTWAGVCRWGAPLPASDAWKCRGSRARPASWPPMSPPQGTAWPEVDSATSSSSTLRTPASFFRAPAPPAVLPPSSLWIHSSLLLHTGVWGLGCFHTLYALALWV